MRYYIRGSIRHVSSLGPWYHGRGGGTRCDMGCGMRHMSMLEPWQHGIGHGKEDGTRYVSWHE